MLIQRLAATAVAIAGACLLGYAVVKLRATGELADKAAKAALVANGGFLQADDLVSHRRIGADTQLEKCALIGLAGTVLLGVGAFNATTRTAGKTAVLKN